MRTLFTILLPLILITSCKESLVITEVEDEYRDVDSTVVRDSDTWAMIGPYKTRLDSTMEAVICQSAQPLPKDRSAMESALGNFMADLSYEWIKQETPDTMPQPDFALLNKGGIRSSLPEGDVKVRHIYELMPFDNYLVTVEMTGEEAWVLFKYLARVGGQPIANAKVGIRNSGPVDIMIDGEPFNIKKTYYVVTSNYLAGGGDNMEFFVGRPQYTHGLLRDYIIKECIRLDEKGEKIEAVKDGRIWGDK